MRKYIAVFFVILLILLAAIFTYLRPTIKISDDLAYHLKYEHRYKSYVDLLNKSSKNDTSALVGFLGQGNFYDATVNDHGWVIAQLIEKDGDSLISSILVKIDSNQKGYLKDYIELGIEHHYPKLIDSFISKYPKVCKSLGIVPRSFSFVTRMHLQGVCNA